MRSPGAQTHATSKEVELRSEYNGRLRGVVRTRPQEERRTKARSARASISLANLPTTLPTLAGSESCFLPVVGGKEAICIAADDGDDDDVDLGDGGAGDGFGDGCGSLGVGGVTPLALPLCLRRLPFARTSSAWMRPVPPGDVPRALDFRRWMATNAASGPPSCCTITTHAAESSASAATTRAVNGKPALRWAGWRGTVGAVVCVGVGCAAVRSASPALAGGVVVLPSGAAVDDGDMRIDANGGVPVWPLRTDLAAFNGELPCFSGEGLFDRLGARLVGEADALAMRIGRAHV